MKGWEAVLVDSLLERGGRHEAMALAHLENPELAIIAYAEHVGRTYQVVGSRLRWEHPLGEQAGVELTFAGLQIESLSLWGDLRGPGFVWLLHVLGEIHRDPLLRHGEARVRLSGHLECPDRWAQVSRTAALRHHRSLDLGDLTRGQACPELLHSPLHPLERLVLHGSMAHWESKTIEGLRVLELHGVPRLTVEAIPSSGALEEIRIVELSTSLSSVAPLLTECKDIGFIGLEEPLKFLRPMLERPSRVSVLDLSGCTIGDECAQILIERRRHLEHLQHLNLSGTFVSSELCQELRRSLDCEVRATRLRDPRTWLGELYRGGAGRLDGEFGRALTSE